MEDWSVGLDMVDLAVELGMEDSVVGSDIASSGMMDSNFHSDVVDMMADVNLCYVYGSSIHVWSYS